MHSNVSILHKEDYLNAVKLVAEIVKALNDETVKILCGKKSKND